MSMLYTMLEKLSEQMKSTFSLILPNGEEVKFGEKYGNCTFKIIVNPEGLRALKSGDELKISEAYVASDIDLSGEVNMLKLLEVTKLFANAPPWIITWSRVVTFFRSQKLINSQSISQHYEFDNDFYLFFLDKTRTYSHGLFINDDEPHEQASLRKLEFALNNCHLQSGDKVLDIGAGWGNIVEYLANKKIQVDAVTLSNQSESFINQLIKEKGLANCRVIKKDFLEYELSDGKPYDALFSLGTLEHLPDYPRALQKCAELLKKGGYAYFDASAKIAGEKGSFFIERHIFPGNHELLDIFSFLNAVKNSPFELISLANDTHHYYLTLLHWAKNLDVHQDEIIGRWGKILYRKFKLYLWGCCFAMRNHSIQAYRIVLRKKND